LHARVFGQLPRKAFAFSLRNSFPLAVTAIEAVEKKLKNFYTI